jgi:UDPglucose--hexose-1-phosphate uridylyltransferase
MQAETTLIWNPILRQYMINAPHRMSRHEGTTICPFCADITSGLVGSRTRVWLHLNNFPPPIGEVYVIIYSREHDRTFTQLSVDEVNVVTHLWRALYNDLATRYATVVIFENSGESDSLPSQKAQELREVIATVESDQTVSFRSGGGIRATD